MAIERAATEIVRKPWGSRDLRPWSDVHDQQDAIGEIWFQRADPAAPRPALLLKLLFTTERLSVQVHPGDDYARSIGLANGKTEAWYILAAATDGKIALGLTQTLTTAQLRRAVDDGSIAGLVDWRDIHADDAISVLAGTIHAIGAGLVVAEIQQRSDTTFRLFDYGRDRELQVDAAVAVAEAGPTAAQAPAYRLGDARTVLVANAYFVFERIDLPPRTHWRIKADSETWLLIREGHGRLGSLKAVVGEAYFLDDSGADIDVGHAGLSALVAYVGTVPRPALLSGRRQTADASPILARPSAIPSPLSALPPARLRKAKH